MKKKSYVNGREGPKVTWRKKRYRGERTREIKRGKEGCKREAKREVKKKKKKQGREEIERDEGMWSAREGRGVLSTRGRNEVVDPWPDNYYEGDVAWRKTVSIW